MKLNFIPYLQNLFKPEEIEYVAVDIGAGALKCVYIKGGKVQKVCIEKNNGKPAAAVNAWLKKEGLSSKNVRLAIKSQETLVRYIPFPKVDKKNLKEVFGYEISKFIPFNNDDIYYDVAVLDENYSASELFVILAVAKREFLNSLIQSVTEEGINLVEINFTSIALINLFLHTQSLREEAGKRHNVALLDIGKTSTSLNLIKKGVPCLSREIKVSSADFFQRLVKVKNMSKDAAEKVLAALNAPRETSDIQEIIEIIEETIVELCEEIKNSLDYFEVNWGQRIQEIHITGGLTKIKGIDKIMVNSLGIETKLFNPFDELPFEFDSAITESKEILGPVLGLSL